MLWIYDNLQAKERWNIKDPFHKIKYFVFAFTTFAWDQFVPESRQEPRQNRGEVCRDAPSGLCRMPAGLPPPRRVRALPWGTREYFTAGSRCRCISGRRRPVGSGRRECTAAEASRLRFLCRKPASGCSRWDFHWLEGDCCIWVTKLGILSKARD